MQIARNPWPCISFVFDILDNMVLKRTHLMSTKVAIRNTRRKRVTYCFSTGYVYGRKLTIRKSKAPKS